MNNLETIINDKKDKLIYLVNSFFLRNMDIMDKNRYLSKAMFCSTHNLPHPLQSSSRRNLENWKNHAHPESYMCLPECDFFKFFKDTLPLIEKDGKILDVGCNNGAMLNMLYHHGYRNLWGVDVGEKAIKLFEMAHPVTYKESKVFNCDAVQFLKRVPANSFDLVYTHSVLVNIRDNDIISLICRASRRYVLIHESEGSIASAPRDFERLFRRFGFEQISFNWYMKNPDGGGMMYPCVVDDGNFLDRRVVRLFVKTRYGKVKEK